MIMSKIAVVMSVYKNDVPIYLECAINSIINQTYQNIKLFIMVDGRVDNDLLSILDKYKPHEKIVIYKRDNNYGLAHSLNELIDTVLLEKDYKYIARMDSDDESLPFRLCEQVQFMEQNLDIDVVGSYCHEFGSEFALNIKKVPLDHERLVEYTFYKCPFIHPTVMFRANIFLDNRIRYPIETKLSEDLALWFLLLINDFRFANINKVLLNYRIDDSTLSRRSGMKKALSEVKLRFDFARKMKRTPLEIYLLIFARGVFALCPNNVKKMMYKRWR